MRLTALYDADGKILAAVEDTGRYDHPVPVATEAGTAVGTFDVPEAASESSLYEICTMLRVDAGAARLVTSG
ncbi:hypothetical protein ACH4E8_05565 [Streptomyces sp. NPDC017979]|uniref:hypothetical protein n=1 Tax=Streptomyces sp. NPDC017979 TaxID=3365024 RepID=UPI0037A0D3A3